MAKPVRFRQLAAVDLEDASEYYRQEEGERATLDFIDAVERGIQRISRSPHVGSPRFAFELAIPELRTWPLRRFPYVVFYVVVADEEIDVWRILHTRRDVPATFEPPTSWAAGVNCRAPTVTALDAATEETTGALVQEAVARSEQHRRPDRTM